MLTRALDGELQAEHELSLIEYDVLIQLQTAAFPVQMNGAIKTALPTIA